MNNIFLKICYSLPDKYFFLQSQIQEGIIVDFKKQDDQYNKFILDNVLLNRYENKKGRCFAITKISLSDINTGKSSSLTLGVGYGIILEFLMENESILSVPCDFVNVDTSRINTIFLDSNINILFSSEELSYLNISDVYEIELNNILYYHIKDIEDGDFIAIDYCKNVYKVTHDPFEITLLSEDLSSVLRSEKF